MAEPLRAKTSYAEYLAAEETSAEKHEFLDGEVRAMAGGTISHGALAARLAYLLGAALDGKPCSVFSSDVRVRIEASNRTVYPDLTVVCGRLERSAVDAEAIANPVLIVEVLSDSTEAYDRGEKWRHYRRLPSLHEYVLVSQREPLIEVFRRAGAAWTPLEAGPGESIELASLGVSLGVDALYADPLTQA